MNQSQIMRIKPSTLTPPKAMYLVPNPVLENLIEVAKYKHWLVEFEVDGAPYNITVLAEYKHLAIEYAEGILWLQLGKPDLNGFAPWCISCVDVY